MEQILITYNKLFENFQLKKEKSLKKDNLKKLKSQSSLSLKLPVSSPKTDKVNSFETQLYSLPPDSGLTEKLNGEEESSFYITSNSSEASKSTSKNAYEPQLSQPYSGESPVKTNSGSVTVKYRALYEFVARSEDELNLQPGDVILVFEGHASEPGWLAGQIKDKLGWFPAAFAEPFGAKKVLNISNYTLYYS